MPAHIAALPRGRRPDTGPPDFTAGEIPGTSGTGGGWRGSSDAVIAGGMQTALDLALNSSRPGEGE